MLPTLLARRLSATHLQSSSSSSSTRLFSAAHDHGHQAPKDPVFLNLPPKRTMEMWEIITYATFGTSFILTALFLTFGPDTNLSTWAANEARVRKARRERGEEVEAGHDYAAEELRSRVKHRRE